MKEVKDPSKYFYANDGKVLKSVQDLTGFLGDANDGVFSYHANSEKNDFANWVEFVLKDKALANKMRAAKTRGEMLSALGKSPGSKGKKASKKEVISRIRRAHSK